MKTFSALAPVLLAITASALPVVTTPENAVSIVPMTWTGKAFLDGEDLTLNGTVQEVYAQVLKINPDFDTHVAPANLRAAAQMEKRQPTTYCDNMLCGPGGINGDYCDVNRMLDGSDYLMRLSGSTQLPAGNGVCSRISCSYNAAIYMCNDDQQHGLTLALNFAGHMARDLSNPSCSAPNNFEVVRGHCFRGPYHDGNSDNYNIWVRGDRC